MNIREEVVPHDLCYDMLYSTFINLPCENNMAAGGSLSTILSDDETLSSSQKK